MNELITIIINVYNGEKFVEKCLNSIINQTYKNLEILIINDGSTDNTLKECQKFQDKRIRIITTENKGLSLSRNVGTEESKGEYLYFIDIDDFIELDTIEYLYYLTKKYNADIASCKPLTIFNYNFIFKNRKEKIEILSNYDMLKKVLLSEEGSGAIWNKLYKKELFNDIRFENRIINDLAVMYKIVLKAERIVYSNQIKYFYLKHKNAITIKNDKNLDRIIDNYKVAVERYKYIKKIYPNCIENEIGYLRTILKLYLISNKDVEEYLEKQEIIEEFRKIMKYKMLISNIKLKEKVKLVLFKINPKLYRIIAIKYRNRKYQYSI